jgi:hypothetical protein
MTSILDGSDRDHNLSDLVARLHEAVRFDNFVEGKSAGDDRGKRPVGQAFGHEAFESPELGIIGSIRGQGDTTDMRLRAKMWNGGTAV